MASDPYERVASDPDLRRELKVARSVGQPLSVFRGQPRGFTATRVSGGWRLLEDGWSREDRELLLALQEWEDNLCGGCGEPLAETTAPENMFAYKGELPVRCHRCTAVAVAAEGYEKSPHPHALMFPVSKRPPRKKSP